MSKLLFALGWILIVGAVVSIAAVPWLPTTAIEIMKAAVPSGVLIALAGHLLTQGRAAKDAHDKQSQYYLDSCILAYERARELLQDGNNDRATWIAAGRALVHARELSKRVTSDSHKRVLELQRLKYRGFFHGLLADRSGSFFYGVDATLELAEAAKASSASSEHAGRRVTSEVRQLSPKSLYAVWEAAQWPAEYDDPLDRDFAKTERGRLVVLFPGLYEYLESCRQYTSASGKLFPNNTVEPAQAQRSS